MKLPFVAGSLGVWTLMDYFGEPHGTGTSSWPYVICDFGQFDIAGFPKSHAYWYTSNWLQAVPLSDAGRPPLPQRPVARILDLPPFGDKATLRAIVTAPFSQLYQICARRPTAAFDKFGVDGDELTGAYWFAPMRRSSHQRKERARESSRRTPSSRRKPPPPRAQAQLRCSLASDRSREALLLDADTPSCASIVDANNGALISSATDRIAWRRLGAGTHGRREQRRPAQPRADEVHSSQRMGRPRARVCQGDGGLRLARA